MNRTMIGALAVAAGGALFALPSLAEDTRVGVAAAVNPAATGQPQSGVSQTLVVGNDVLYKERIATAGVGQVQLLFVDQSSLTVAPDSEVVIDEFVYDPARNTGKLAANVGKGLLRYVGGRISKQTDVTFATPGGVVGIRGGMGFIDVGAKGEMTAVFLYGIHLCVTGGGTTECATHPGYQIILGGVGMRPSKATQAPAALVAGYVAKLEGHTDTGVGANLPPGKLAALDSPDLPWVDGRPPVDVTHGLQSGDPTPPRFGGGGPPGGGVIVKVPGTRLPGGHRPIGL